MLAFPVQTTNYPSNTSHMTPFSYFQFLMVAQPHRPPVTRHNPETSRNATNGSIVPHRPHIHHRAHDREYECEHRQDHAECISVLEEAHRRQHVPAPRTYLLEVRICVLYYLAGWLDRRAFRGRFWERTRSCGRIGAGLNPSLRLNMSPMPVGNTNRSRRMRMRETAP